MAEVVCLGILVADIFGSPIPALPEAGELALLERYLLSVGGCAANVAVDLRRLGRTASIVGKVGCDLFGDFVLGDLKRLGIETSCIRRSEIYPTSCTFIINVRGQDRRYVHCFGANADFSLADVETKVLDGARALYVGGYLAMPSFRPQHLVKLFREAKQRGLLTALDVVIPAGVQSALEEIRLALMHTDLFLPNQDEARVLTGSGDPEEQADILSRINPDATIVITRGSRGALATRQGEVLRATAYRVDSIDESGSGDAFAGGFLVSMLDGRSLEDSLRFASAIGASCTRALGCHAGVFHHDEAVAFLAKNRLEVVKYS